MWMRSRKTWVPVRNRICSWPTRGFANLNRTIETAANGVKDAMFEKEKTFVMVRAWSEAHKDGLIPIHELRGSLKQELVELEKQETNRREEGWFKKKVELEMMFEKNKLNMKCPNPRQ